MKKKFWKNKRILITGHTGFKGSWLTLILSTLKAKIIGYALYPTTQPNFFDNFKLSQFLIKDFREDILNKEKLEMVIKKFRPNIIFHLAAQSSVLESYKTPYETIETNILGTVNILEIVKKFNFIKSLIIVTTDKVYLNLEKKKPFKENDSLGGHDVYSGSKAAVEIITQSYKESFFKSKLCKIATVRAGNCIGGGDWTKDRIVKDCAESFLSNKKIVIRSPNATRPWQHVIEPLFGYLNLAEKLYKNQKFANQWNFGPNKKNNMKVIEVARFAKKYLNSSSKIKFRKQKYYESTYLSLDSSKSKKILQWKTLMNSKQALRLSLDWYRLYYEKKNIEEVIKLTFQQIKHYMKNYFKQ